MKTDKLWKQQAISGLLIGPAIPHSAWFRRLTEIRSTPAGKPLHSLSAFFSFEFSRFSQAAIYLEPDRYGISLFVQKWRSALSSIFYRPASHTLSTLFYSSKKNGLMVFQLYPLSHQTLISKTCILFPVQCRHSYSYDNRLIHLLHYKL